MEKQQKVLIKLLENSINSAFSKYYRFDKILSAKDVVAEFKSRVPVGNYLTMKDWWTRCLNGEEDVVIDGPIKYFALSSGTSDGASKFIPVSKRQLSQLRRQGLRMSLNIARNKNIPTSTFRKHHLLIGGSTSLKYNGHTYSGDLSGIAQLNIPFWYQSFSKPGREVMRLQWDDKIDQMVEHAHEWDISMITGIPSWVQLLLEKVIKHHNLKNIHELWPSLKVYIHSGISAEPYYKSINNLFGEKVYWYESYLASEGFFAYKEKPEKEGMKLIIGDSIFYEFIPFNDKNFDENGNPLPNAEVLAIDAVEEGINYAMLITTCSGAWRYMIGDTVRFTNKEAAEIAVTGRTKHFLSVTGEHLSVDNMSHAIVYVSDAMNFICKEFTVYAEKQGDSYVHVWNIGCDVPMDEVKLAKLLDDKLRELNDDYDTERKFALGNVVVNLMPNDVFYEFLSKRGKTGGQVKFPRVMNGELLQQWKEMINLKK